MPLDQRILKGEAPITELFQAFAHKWVPTSELWQLPRDQWQPAGVAALRELYAVYRRVRPLMRRRTVLEDGLGVRWQGAAGETVLWAFAAQPTPTGARDALTGDPVTTATLAPDRVYLW